MNYVAVYQNLPVSPVPLFTGLAATCLQNIRQTFRFGGRKNVPSRMELEAITVRVCR